MTAQLETGAGELMDCEDASIRAAYLRDYANTVSKEMYGGERPSGVWNLERAANLLDQAVADHTQAQAKIAQLEGEVAERDARIAELEALHELASECFAEEHTARLSAEADAAKVREAGAGLVEWADEFCRTGKAPTYDAIWPMRKALAAQTERRA